MTFAATARPRALAATGRNGGFCASSLAQRVRLRALDRVGMGFDS